jgi:hypothetical protein
VFIVVGRKSNSDEKKVDPLCEITHKQDTPCTGYYAINDYYQQSKHDVVDNKPEGPPLLLWELSVVIYTLT